MENIFVIDEFESGWRPQELYGDIYSQESYCVNALNIPDEKIYGTEMIDNALEVILTDIQTSEMDEDWYINLTRVSA